VQLDIQNPHQATLLGYKGLAAPGCDKRHSRMCHITQPCALAPGGPIEVPNAAVDRNLKQRQDQQALERSDNALLVIFGRLGTVEDDCMPGRRHGNVALHIAPQDAVEQRGIDSIGAGEIHP